MTEHGILDRHGAGDHEAARQKREIIALWIFLAVLIAVGIGLSWADSHGFWQTIPGQTAPAWPAGWP